MAFDVRGLEVQGLRLSGWRAGGRSGWIGGDPVRVHDFQLLLMASRLPSAAKVEVNKGFTSWIQ